MAVRGMAAQNGSAECPRRPPRHLVVALRRARPRPEGPLAVQLEVLSAAARSRVRRAESLGSRAAGQRRITAPHYDCTR